MEIINKVRGLGIGYVLEALFERVIPAWLFRICLLEVYQLDFDKLSAARLSNASVNICDNEHELEQLKELTSHGSVEPHFIGVLARVEGQAAGGLWMATKEFRDNDVGLSFTLEAGHTWIYAARVEPHYRRQGIYSHLMSESAQSRKRQQKSAPLIAVSRLNRASRKGIQRFGTLVGKVLVIRIGSVAWARSTGDLRQNQNWTFQCSQRPIHLKLAGQAEESSEA